MVFESGGEGMSARDRAMAAGVAESVAGTLRVVGDPIRLRLLSGLATAETGEVSAGELAAIVDVTAPTVSHHLRVLREVGLVAADRASTVFYRIPAGVQHAVTVLLEVFAPLASQAGAPDGGAPDELSGVDPLRHADDLIGRIGDKLVERNADLAPDVVLRTVRESYTALLRTARIARYVPVLAERFAKQRLEDLRRIEGRDGDTRPQVLFVCVANAGRSQLAAALMRHYVGDAAVIRSAGSHPADEVHPAVRPLLEELGEPGDDAPFPKPLTDDAVRAADVVITMGCGDVCPVFPGKRYEDWALGDPALASPEGVRAIRDDIDARVRALALELLDRVPRAART
jgi:ArsR family transcriptional regulator